MVVIKRTEPKVVDSKGLRWLWKEAKKHLQLTVDQRMYVARLRRNQQISVPVGILCILAKSLNIPREELEGGEIVFEIHAIHIKNIWYRLSPIGEDTQPKEANAFET